MLRRAGLNIRKLWDFDTTLILASTTKKNDFLDNKNSIIC